MTHEPLSLVVELDDERRLTIEPWTNVGGRRLISVKPEHVDRSGGWHLSHSGLLLAPTAARALALLLEQMADHVDGDGR